MNILSIVSFVCCIAKLILQFLLCDFDFKTNTFSSRVRVCDERIGDVVMLFAGGHHDAITCVQMDEWKVLSGGQDGYVCSWDQRMTHKMWDMYNR